MPVVEQVASTWLGLGAAAESLTFVQIGLRAVIVSAATLVMTRVGHRRFLAQLSTFDAVVVFRLASMLARRRAMVRARPRVTSACRRPGPSARTDGRYVDRSGSS